MMFLFRTHYKLAKDALRQNRVRSFLTCLGIAIGVASIILILSLMGSIDRLITNQVKSTGQDLIVVRPTTHKTTIDSVLSELTSGNQYLKSNLSLTDVETIKNQENIAAVAPLAVTHATISANRMTADRSTGERSTEKRIVDSASVVGTSADFVNIQNLPLRSGSFLDDNSKNRAAVIGKNLSLELFGSNEPVGKTFTLFGKKFLITGALGQIDDPINFNNIDFDNSLFISAKHLQELDASGLQIQQINIKAATVGNINDTVDKIEAALTEEKSGDTNFAVYSGNQISHPAGSLMQIVSSMLTLVASISLIVGGIGVMNIMLVAVGERTHEIGIRKAVGASGIHILVQFLFEALTLSFLGGIFGLILGYILAFIISTITPFAPFISWQILLITLITSFSIGTIFGLYPALRAARKNPIDSLRYYR